MAEILDPKTLEAFVSQVVDQATDRLTTAAADALKRQTGLATAKKDPGNRLRSNDIRSALDAEDQLAGDARVLAKKMTTVKRSMNADLQRLVTAAQSLD